MQICLMWLRCLVFEFSFHKYTVYSQEKSLNTKKILFKEQYYFAGKLFGGYQIYYFFVWLHDL